MDVALEILHLVPFPRDSSGHDDDAHEEGDDD